MIPASFLLIPLTNSLCGVPGVLAHPPPPPNTAARPLPPATRPALRRAVATGVKPALQPCTCGKVLCPGHARGFSTGLGAALAEAAAQHEL